METFRITVEIADPRGQHFEAVEMLVDTGATFTKAPRDLLERLGVPVESTYTSELADGSSVERTQGRAVIRLEGSLRLFHESPHLALCGAIRHRASGCLKYPAADSPGHPRLIQISRATKARAALHNEARISLPYAGF